PDLDRPNPGLDGALRTMAVPHYAVAAVRQLQVLPLGDEGIGFGNQYLRQHSPGAFTCDFSQGIVDRFGLTEWDDGAISRHGVWLFAGGSGRLGTRLDTPPSIKRRHPDSRIAPIGLRRPERIDDLVALDDDRRVEEFADVAGV